MTKKTFSAQQWLQKEAVSVDPVAAPAPATEQCPVKGRFPKFVHRSSPARQALESGASFSPIQCFVPGWKGDSLFSKTVLKFERGLQTVQTDVRAALLRTEFSRTMKLGLYNEFLSFAEAQGLHFEGMDDMGKFWTLLKSEELPEHTHLNRFLDIYAGRVATIVFLKLRFVLSLLDRCGIALSDKALLYPSAFLAQIFKKGSATELNSRALESNLYSWYQPREEMKECMREMMLVSRDLSITEIIKNVSARTQVELEQNKLYSHALSQVSFGLFLNSLQINFPMWVATIEGKQLPQGPLNQEEIYSCKYFGDYLESLSLSHWLAQENNLNFHWDQILCPDFKGLEFTSGTFAKLCNELQFLTFLSTKAEHQGEKPIEYICKIMGGHFRNRKNTQGRQTFLLEDNPFYSSTYDRVVLNLCHFPKNNPQHFLMTQILDQVKYLKSDGYLFVFSSKKLFVPSLRERLEPLLRELKTEAIFDFEQVRGKGELGSYLYIFRKRQQRAQDRQTCSYFRLSAELGNFQQFSSITEHLRSFYLSHLTEYPAMSQLEFRDSFRLDYFQEAIVNGMLIHSASEDANRITHPAFFKGLLENCVPFETLFDFRNLNRQDASAPREIGLNLGLKKDLSYFLVVDFRRPEVSIELHPMDTFRSIHSDYGEAQCTYFELLPKFVGLNPNIIRNYFVTPVGKQIVNLTFSGGQNFVKGGLSKLLVPKFLMETEFLPEHLSSTFNLFTLEAAELMQTSPAALIKTFNHVEQVTREILPRYACEILSRYSTFERTLESLIWNMDDGRLGQRVCFNNPLIQAQLVQKKTAPLYPDNSQVYTEFVDGRPMDLHLPLSASQIKVTHEGELKLYSLELISGDRIIVRLHTEEAMILFIHFLTSHAVNVPISKVLKALHVPSIDDLNAVIETTATLKSTYTELLGKVRNSIMNAFRLHVSALKKPV